MAGTHPDEHALLDYVDGEREPAVAEHVSSCPTCTERIRLLEAGRNALRSAPLLELGEERRREMLVGLPERAERRSRVFARLGPAAAAAAALVLVAGIVALATLAGGGGEGSEEGGGAVGGGGGAAQEAQPGTATTGARAAQDVGEPVRRVQGPANAVLRLLHRRGIPAVLRDGSVLAKADREDVQLALKDRPPGAVVVYIR
jgi:hypothetical protein